MRWIMIVTVSLTWSLTAANATEPLVEKYLHSGQLARGEQVMESALAAAPADDQLRFGLAVLRLVRGVERLGQALYKYGCLSENTNAPFLRIPVPRNPDPSPITYFAFCRLLDAFRGDLATVESTLADIKSDEVNLPLRLADIRLDMTGQGEASERFIEILKKLMGPSFQSPADNPDFLICFDRGDVAWLRAYCHLLMGSIDMSLSYDSEAAFEIWGKRQFANPRPRSEKQNDSAMNLDIVKVNNPARMGHFRRHLLKVCELNRETWRHIRAETDDDHEWLPNPRQTGVLRMPVSDEMIDSWLSMVAEFEALFDGKKAIPTWVVQLLSKPTKKKLNLKVFLDNPPDQMDWTIIRRDGIREAYLDDNLPEIDLRAFVRVIQVFQNALAVGYVAWFN